MIDEYEKTHQKSFRGLYNRGDSTILPPNFFRICNNCRFLSGGFETRYGTGLSISVPIGVLRWFPFKIEGQADRILYLDGSGRIWDSLYVGAPILTIANMIDFSLAVFNGRAYISPHDRRRGLAGQLVYIYQGGGFPARPAAGSRPTGFTLQTTTGSQSGAIETGTHLFAIAYESDTGFITKPGPELFSVYDAPGGTTAHLANISTGPSWIVARHILGTKRVVNYNGDQNAPELFYVPNGKIDDNTTTEWDVNFYDADLQISADYLHDEMETIPAVLGLGSYQGSLVGWGAQNDDSVVYISKASEPESISLIEGGLEVDPSEAGGVRNCVEYRGQLMIHKSTRTYATSNNGQEPVFWGHVSVDRGVGTEIFGIATILDEEGHTVDKYVLADRKGLLLFNGTFEINLTFNINEEWKRITKQYFNTIQVALDPIGEVIYAAVPLDGANTPNAIFYGDYSEGMDPDLIKWSIWTFPYSPTSVGIDLDINRNPVFKIASQNSNIYYLNSAATNDNDVAIPNPTFQNRLTGDEDVAVNQFGGVEFRASGAGALHLEVTGLDETLTVKPPSLSLALTPGKFLTREFELQSRMASVKAYTNSINHRFRITRMTVYHTPVFAVEPTIG